GTEESEGSQTESGGPSSSLPRRAPGLWTMKHHQSPIHVGRAAVPKRTIKYRKMALPDYLDTVDHGMTTTELAGVLGVSSRSIYDTAQAGRIPCYRVGTHVRFDPHIVAKWLRAR